MEQIKKIFDEKGNCLAIVIRKNHFVEKTEFFSDPDYSQQVGIIKYSQNGKIKNHIHNQNTRYVFNTQEVLIIRKGLIKVNIFDSDLKFLESIILEKDDIIFLVSGGHGFDILEDCEIFEVKQGPYTGVNNDKTHF